MRHMQLRLPRCSVLMGLSVSVLGRVLGVDRVSEVPGGAAVWFWLLRAARVSVCQWLIVRLPGPKSVREGLLLLVGSMWEQSLPLSRFSPLC